MARRRLWEKTTLPLSPPFTAWTLDGEKTLGNGHPSTLSTVHNMPSVFWKQGEYDKALKWNPRWL